MGVEDVFEKLRDALDALNIPYFVTGSFASSAHGVPRSTNDIDIVIAPTRQQMEQLLDAFPESEFAAFKEDALDAFDRNSLFNIVEYASMWKIDFIMRQPTAFDAARFARRGIVEIAGVLLYAASAEDTLITKLWWAKLGESERQINDAAGIIRVQAGKLDIGYVEHWVAALALEREWQLARERAAAAPHFPPT